MIAMKYVWKIAEPIAAGVIVLVLATTVSCGGQSDTEDIAPGDAPIANAGVDGVYHILDEIRLDGTASTSSQETSLRYRWRQVSGPQARFSSNDSATPILFTPGDPGVIVLQLQVSDGLTVSPPDEVTITLLDYQGARSDFSASERLHHLKFIGRHTRGVVGLSIAGNLAFVTNRSDGLTVIDITDPLSPKRIGSPTSFRKAAGTTNVTVEGTIAYVGSNTAGNFGYHNGAVHVVDVSNPQSPIQLSEVHTDGPAGPLTVVGDFVYVPDGNQGLAIIDVTDPNNATKITPQLETGPGTGGVLVRGNLAYVTSRDGLVIVDIDDPRNPIIADQIGSDVSGIAAAEDGFVYLAEGSDGLAIIDVSDPYNATRIKQIDVQAGSVAVSGGFAYVTWRNELTIVDISDAPNAVEIAPPVVFERFVSQPVVVDDYVYASSGSGMTVVDVSDFRAAKEISHIGTNSPVGILVEGGFAYLAGADGLAIIDRANAQAPDISFPFVDTGGEARGLIMDENMAYIVNKDFAGYDSSIAMVDVTAPNKPFRVGPQITTEGSPQSVAVVDQVVYVADGSEGLAVIDVADPKNPSKMTPQLSTNGDATSVSVAGDFAYVASGSGGVTIFDISDRQSPTRITAVEIVGEARRVEVVGDFAYVAADVGGIAVIDITDPREPMKVTQIDLGYRAMRVNVLGDLAAVRTLSNGVMLVDIVDPRKPQIITRIDRRDPVPHENPRVQFAMDGEVAIVDVNRVDKREKAIVMLGSGKVVGGAAYFRIPEGIVAADFGIPEFPVRRGHFWFGGVGDFVARDGFLYVVTNKSGFTAIPQDTLITFLNNHVITKAGATLEYRISWENLYPGEEHLRCKKTGGTCTVTDVNQTDHTATVVWRLPLEQGDYEVAVAVSNYHYEAIARDRVSVR